MQKAQNQSLARTAPVGNPVAQIKAMTSDPKYIARFQEVMGKKAPQFLASIVSAVRGNSELSKADPNSVMAAAMIAATLDLDINQSLGFAAIVPYKRNRKDPQGNWVSTVEAQFQIMTKGLVQLALRSGQYRNINVVEIYADEYETEDILAGVINIHPVASGDRAHGRTSAITGYAAYLELINGFRKTVYWTMDHIRQHAAKFSKSWDPKTGRFFKGSAWDSNFEAMCRKTVLKNALSSWGILSTQMQVAITSDQGVKLSIDSDTIEYPDNPQGSFDDGENDTATIMENIQEEPSPLIAPAPDSHVIGEEEAAALDALFGSTEVPA